MTLKEIILEKTKLTCNWRKSRFERMIPHTNSAEEIEEAKYLYMLAELDVLEAQKYVDEQ